MLLGVLASAGWFDSRLLGAEQVDRQPESDRNARGWSQDLLARLLDTPEPAVDGRGTASEGMILRSYQLRLLRLGEPGRASNLVNILRRMLPPDSRVTEDRPGNTLHVLSTRAAQQAALELISAMDSEGDPALTRPEPSIVPEEVRKALESLAAARPDSDKLMRILADVSRETEERVSKVVQQGQAETQASVRRMLLSGGATFAALAVLAGIAGVVVVRRSQNRRIQALAQQANALALVPSQGIEAVMAVSRDQQERTKELQKLMESFSISYQADRQRNAVLMETVAQKHEELAATLGQIDSFRRDLGERAGQFFLEVNREAIDHIIQRASDALQNRAAEVGLIAENASRKMEETANRLEVQNARTQVLAEELERTQQEVDALFQRLTQAQQQAQQAQCEANEQRRIACEKSAELAKREAALAGLSLLMQEPMNTILDTINHEAAQRGTDDVVGSAGTETVLPAATSEGSATALLPVDRSADAEPEDPNSEDPTCLPPSTTYRIMPAA